MSDVGVVPERLVMISYQKQLIFSLKCELGRIAYSGVLFALPVGLCLFSPLLRSCTLSEVSKNVFFFCVVPCIVASSLWIVSLHFLPLCSHFLYFPCVQLDRDAANPAHPLHNFITGNKDTLLHTATTTSAADAGAELRQQLLKFHRENYVGTSMTLAVIGKQSLPDLEAWVKECFSPIPRGSGSGRQGGEVEPAPAWLGKVAPFLPQTSAAVSVYVDNMSVNCFLACSAIQVC